MVSVNPYYQSGLLSIRAVLHHGSSVNTVLCSDVPNLRSRGPVLQGSIFFFSPLAAGLTNRVPVRDSRAGAPLTAVVL